MKPDLKYSQNFISANTLAQRLVNLPAVDIASGDTVLDIGAGKGMLTKHLADKVGETGKVIAVELDAALVTQLRQTFAAQPQVQVVHTDVRNLWLPTTPYKVFSNIPFSSSALILSKLLDLDTGPQSAYIILQQETAMLYGGQTAGARQESMKSLLAFPFFELRVIHRFARHDFTPMPQVDIVLLEINKKVQPLVDNQDMFKDFIAAISPVKVGQTIWRRIFTDTQLNRIAKDTGLKLDKGINSQSAPAIVATYNLFQELVPVAKQQSVSGAFKRLQNQQTKLPKVHRSRVAKNWRGF